MTARRKRSLSERLENYTVNTVTGCHEFGGYIGHNGYGQVFFKGKTRDAHRISWEYVHGTISDGLCVCHKCDNRKCINVNHLFLGTHADNARDRAEKGRSARGVPGWENPSTKLSAESVRDIRFRYSTGERAIKLAAEYGVTDSCIYRVLRYETWPDTAARKQAEEN